MKALAISDIHGDVDHLKQILEIYNKESASRLLILGDFCRLFQHNKRRRSRRFTKQILKRNNSSKRKLR